MKSFYRNLLAVIACISILGVTACGGATTETAPQASASSSKESNEAEASSVEETASIESNQSPESEPEEPVDEKEPEAESQASTPEDTVVEPVVSDLDLSQYTESSGFVFESNNDGTCTLMEIGTCADTAIVIPQKSPDGDAVTKIEEYAFYKLDADTVVINGLDVVIDSAAFEYGEFTSLIIANSTIETESSVFSNCDKLQSIIINSSTVDFDEYSFYKVGKAGTLTISNCNGTLGDACFEYSDIENITITSSDLAIEESSFSNCEDVVSLSITDSSIKAKEYAFYKIGDGATVEIANTDLVLEDAAFEYSSLAAVTISGENVKMGTSAFANVEDLTTLVIDGNSIELGEYAFYKNGDLESVSICMNNNSDTNKIKIGDAAFEYSDILSTVLIGKGEVEIGDSAFLNCTALSNVTIESDAKVGDYTFYKCAEDLVITCAGQTYTSESIEDK